MIRVLLLLSALSFSVLFLVYSPVGTIGFPYSKMVLSAETWFYFLFEHLILVLLALVILSLEHEFKYCAAAFLLIQIVDTVDYCLIYGEPWSKNIPSWNVLKITIFGAVMAYEVIKLKTWNKS